MIDSGKLRGTGVRRKEAFSIMAAAHRASNKFDCPYSRNTHKWSIWNTAFRNKRATNEQVYAALIKAGVKIYE